MVEAENITALGDRANYGLPDRSCRHGRRRPADHGDQPGLGDTKYDTTLKAGCQRIVLTTTACRSWLAAEHVTYDAASIESKYSDFNSTTFRGRTAFSATWSACPPPTATDSESHFSTSLQRLEIRKVTAYAYCWSSTTRRRTSATAA